MKRMAAVKGCDGRRTRSDVNNDSSRDHRIVEGPLFLLLHADSSYLERFKQNLRCFLIVRVLAVRSLSSLDRQNINIWERRERERERERVQESSRERERVQEREKLLLAFL